MSGTTFGSKIRRWWYKTNNWKLPSLNNMKTRVSKLAKDQKLAKDMGEVSRAYLHSLVVNRRYFALGFLREFSGVWNFWG